MSGGIERIRVLLDPDSLQGLDADSGAASELVDSVRAEIGAAYPDARADVRVNLCCSQIVHCLAACPEGDLAAERRAEDVVTELIDGAWDRWVQALGEFFAVEVWSAELQAWDWDGTLYDTRAAAELALAEEAAAADCLRRVVEVTT